MKSTILASIICFLLVACKSSNEHIYKQPEFPIVNEKVSYKFLTDDLGFNSIYDMVIYENCIYIIAYNAENQMYLHSYDINTGKKLESRIKLGNGPGELIYPGISYFDYDTGHLYFYDKVKQTSVKFDLSDNISLINTKQNFSTPWITHDFPLSGIGEIVVTSADNYSNDYRISLYDIENRNVLSKYDIFPLEKNSEARHIVYQTDRADVSLDKKYLVLGTSYGSILEIFDINKGIQLKNINYFIEPTIKMRGSTFDIEDTVLGFNDIFATSKYVYAAYDGENQGDVTINDFFNNIAVFDYKGHPVSLSRIGNTVERLCVDENSGKIYCVLTLKAGEVKIAMLHITDIFGKNK